VVGISAGGPISIRATSEGQSGTASVSVKDLGGALFGVMAVTADNVFAVGDGGKILHYDGTNWSPQSSGTEQALYAISLLGSGTNCPIPITVGAAGTVLAYNGTWRGQFAEARRFGLFGVSAAPGSRRFIAVGTESSFVIYDYDRPGGYHGGYLDAGQPWYGVFVFPGGDGLHVGAGGGLECVLVDSSFGPCRGYWGDTSGTTNDLFGVWGYSDTNAFFVGAGGTIGHFDGTSWRLQTSGTVNTLRGVTGVDPASNIFVVGDNGTILHSSDGSSWSPQASGTTNDLLAVWAVSANDVFSVGEGETILHYDGIAWSQQR
jgi:photosystem II stability/assembly factor-like uncharacterized protein